MRALLLIGMLSTAAKPVVGGEASRNLAGVAAVASYEPGDPWPRRYPFQAGVAASAGFKIRKCLADSSCPWSQLDGWQ